MKKRALLLFALLAGIALCGCVGTKELADVSSVTPELTQA